MTTPSCRRRHREPTVEALLVLSKDGLSDQDAQLLLCNEVGLSGAEPPVRIDTPTLATVLTLDTLRRYSQVRESAS